MVLGASILYHINLGESMLLPADSNIHIHIYIYLCIYVLAVQKQNNLAEKGPACKQDTSTFLVMLAREAGIMCVNDSHSTLDAAGVKHHSAWCAEGLWRNVLDKLGPDDA